MAGLNKAMVIGNLGKDPELRTTGSGKSVCNFSVATNESWKDASGEKQERTEWHRIVVWGPQAEACGKYLAKGRQVYVEGRIQSREWEDNDVQEVHDGDHREQRGVPERRGREGQGRRAPGAAADRRQ